MASHSYRIVASRAWMFVPAICAAAQVFAQAPVEERHPATNDTGAVQRRIDFARQALDRAEARVRDAMNEHEAAKRRFDEAKKRLDETAKKLERAKAASSSARKNYDAQSSEFERQRAGKGG